jgi:hypothetical protein
VVILSIGSDGSLAPNSALVTNGIWSQTVVQKNIFSHKNNLTGIHYSVPETVNTSTMKQSSKSENIKIKFIKN